MAIHIDLTGGLHVAAPPEQALVYFTPEGERLYVPGWAPEYLHPADGALAEGLTFRTTHDDETTLWLVSRCDVPAGRLEYVRVVPGSRLGTVSVRLSPGAGGGADVAVSYRMTSLSAAGDEALRRFADGFDAMLASWERTISGVLAADRGSHEEADTAITK